MDGAEIRANDVIEAMVHPVDNGVLMGVARVEDGGVGDVANLGLEGLELEGELEACNNV